MRMVKTPVIRTVIGVVGSKVEISFIGQPKPAGKGPQKQPSTPVKSVFEVKHYRLKKRQKHSMYYLQKRFQVMEGTG